MAYRNRLAGTDRVSGNRAQIAVHGARIALFVVGGVIGAAGCLVVGFAVLVPCALLLLLVSYQPLLVGLSARREVRP